MNNFLRTFEHTVKRCWDLPALEGYNIDQNYTYGELAAQIVHLNRLWSAAGLKPGDRVAINAKSSVNWILVRMAALCGGYTNVELLNGFMAKDVQSMTVHSEARILYTESQTFSNIDFEAMPLLVAAIDLNTGKLLASRGDFACLYSEMIPEPVSVDSFSVPDQDLERIGDIMYTSGSTGNPKGVMLSLRNIGANVYIVPKGMHYEQGASILSILPYAHIFGLVMEVTIPLCSGMRVVVLGQPPVPTVLRKALMEVKPVMYYSVPLVLMKFVNAVIGKDIESAEGKRLLASNDREFCTMLHDRMMEAMGGNVRQIFTGAAAIPFETEDLLLNKIGLPFVTGYGMTEVGCILSSGHVGTYKIGSVGEVMTTLGIRIDSEDPFSVPGELQVKGDQVFMGYFKNPAATADSFTADGWYRTGDVGRIDKDRSVFLSGRCKSLILGSNGQNIYPEEIEVVLNTMPYVEESLVIQRGDSRIALIVLKDNAIKGAGLTVQNVRNIMRQNIKDLNSQIPVYSYVSDFEIMDAPFEKTPKGTIKRFKYSK